MIRLSKKYIDKLVNRGDARDLTCYDPERMNKFLKAHNLEKIGVSYNAKGLTGGLMQDIYTGELYAMVSPSAALNIAFKED